MPTRRTPIVRHARRGRITPVAVLLFRAMERTECTCPPGRAAAIGKVWIDECVGRRCWWDLHYMLHAVVGGRIWEYPVYEYSERAEPDDPCVRLFHRLVAAAATQEAGEIALTDAQVHAFHKALNAKGAASRPNDDS
jgi:hypothetical protein